MRENLHGTWQQRKEHLDCVYDQQMFYREAQALDALSKSQEVKLNAVINGDSVEQVEVLIKKHDTFVKRLATQENRVGEEHGGYI